MIFFQKVKKMEHEIESLRSSSGVTSVAGSIEGNIDSLSLPTTDSRRTESMGSGSSGIETSIVSFDFFFFTICFIRQLSWEEIASET